MKISKRSSLKPFGLIVGSTDPKRPRGTRPWGYVSRRTTRRLSWISAPRCLEPRRHPLGLAHPPTCPFRLSNLYRSTGGASPGRRKAQRSLRLRLPRVSGGDRAPSSMRPRTSAATSVIGLQVCREVPLILITYAATPPASGVFAFHAYVP